MLCGLYCMHADALCVALYCVHMLYGIRYNNCHCVMCMLFLTHPHCL